MKIRTLTALLPILTILLGQMVPAGGQAFAASQPVETLSQVTAKENSTATLVRIIPLPVQPKIVVPASLPSVEASCSASSSGQDIALQNTLNSSLLKLPASCFAIAPKATVATPEIQLVKDPAPQTRYTIVVLPYAIQYLNQRSGTAALPSREVPVLPPALASFIPLVVPSKKMQLGKLNKIFLSLDQSLSLNQLQVFRC